MNSVIDKTAIKMISTRNIYYFKKLLPFPIIWFVSAVLYSLIEKGILGDSEYYPSTGNMYDFSGSLSSIMIGSIIMGFLMGVLEVTLFKNIMKRKSFLKKVCIKIILYVIAITIFLLTFNVIVTTMKLNVGLQHPAVKESLFSFVGNYAFVSIVIYAGVFSFIGFFVTEAIDGLGLNIVSNFFTGKYEKPIIEQRIFMFLDMKSSTTIAENLGNIAYYKLLKLYYKSMTEAIISTRGEVYQYVGDEIVISWDIKNGLRNNNCLQCFFKIKHDIEMQKNLFMKDYGIFPEFKAGIHLGDVTAGTIGVIKKEILYTGDVLNTTARIQSQCNELASNLLLSQNLVTKLEKPEDFRLIKKGEFELRGKNEKVILYAASAS